MLNSVIVECLSLMKRRFTVCLALVALGLTSTAYPTTAADYGTTPYRNSPNTVQPLLLRANVPGPPGNTNASAALSGESDIKAQFILLSALAQDHRERAEAATRNGQADLAKWESGLADELGHCGSNLLAQPEGADARKRALLDAGPGEASGSLSSAELDYLAKLQERIQALQQVLVAATEETRVYALQVATNRNVTDYTDNSSSLRLQEIGREIQRVQAEQADLELKKTHFWALRAMVRNALSPRSSETNQPVPKAPVSANGQ